MAKRRGSRWARRIAVILLVGMAVVLVTAWMMFQHIPAWYRPPEVPLYEIQTVKDDFVATFDRLSEALNKSAGPFEYRFTQDQINTWLAIREQMWPGCRKWIPPFMEDPMVVIEPDGVRLATVFRRRSLRSVVSAQLKVWLDGSGVEVRLGGVSGGDLPLPRSEVRKLLANIDRKAWPVGRRIPGQIGQRPLPPLGGLFEGVTFPGEWVWANGRQPFRITKLDFQHGVVVVTFEPLARQGGGNSRASRMISPGVAPAGN